MGFLKLFFPKKTFSECLFLILKMSIPPLRTLTISEGKFGLKPSLKKEKTKVLSTRRYGIYVSQIEKLIWGIWLLKRKVQVFCRFTLLFKSTFSHTRPSWTNKWKFHTSWMSLVWAIISTFNSNLFLCCVFHERGFR